MSKLMGVTGEALDKLTLQEIFSEGACSCPHWEEGNYCHHPDSEDTFPTGEHCCPHTGDWKACDLVTASAATCSFCITPRYCNDHECKNKFAKELYRRGSK